MTRYKNPVGKKKVAVIGLHSWREEEEESVNEVVLNLKKIR